MKGDPKNDSLGTPSKHPAASAQFVSGQPGNWHPLCETGAKEKPGH